jgi:hypothetical protein
MHHTLKSKQKFKFGSIEPNFILLNLNDFISSIRFDRTELEKNRNIEKIRFGSIEIIRLNSVRIGSVRFGSIFQEVLEFHCIIIINKICY